MDDDVVKYLSIEWFQLFEHEVDELVILDIEDVVVELHDEDDLYEQLNQLDDLPIDEVITDDKNVEQHDDVLGLMDDVDVMFNGLI